MSFDDAFLNGDKAGIYSAIRSSRKTDRLKMVGRLLEHYYSNDPLLSELGAYLVGGQKDDTKLVFLSKNRLTRAMVDIERIDDPSLTYEEALEVVGGRLGVDADTVRKSYSRGGSGQKQRNSSTDPDNK